jgi:4-carboxymuconolactone decarboxylase
LPLIALLTGGRAAAAPASSPSKGPSMTDTPGPRKSPFGDIAPALGDYTNNVLFGDVWKRPELSARDRSLVTVSSLIAQYRINELPFHLKFALQNGVTREELIEAITHLAFYAGWPTASTAIGIARHVFDEAGK